MLNNKGFAVTSVLYTLLIAFLLFLGACLTQFSSSNKIFSKANTDLEANYSTFNFSNKGNLVISDSGTTLNNFPLIRTFYKIHKDYIKSYDYEECKDSVNNFDNGTFKLNKIKDNEKYYYVVPKKRTSYGEKNDNRTLLLSYYSGNYTDEYYDHLTLPFDAKNYYLTKISKGSIGTSTLASYETFDWSAKLKLASANTSEKLSSSNVTYGDVKRFLYQYVDSNSYSNIELSFTAVKVPKVNVYYRVKGSSQSLTSYDENKYATDGNLLIIKGSTSHAVSSNYSTNYELVSFPINAKTDKELGIKMNGYNFNGWDVEIKYWASKEGNGSSQETIKKENVSNITKTDIENYIKNHPLSNDYTISYIQIVFVAKWKKI